LSGFFYPIFRHYFIFNNKEAKASERSENERKCFLLSTKQALNAL
jgi:hypothetical protein